MLFWKKQKIHILYERYMILRQSAKKGNARKAKEILIFTGILLWLLVVFFRELFYKELCQCNAEVGEDTDSLTEMKSEEDEDIDESFWTVVFRLQTFNVFCSHITWQNYCFFL